MKDTSSTYLRLPSTKIQRVQSLSLLMLLAALLDLSDAFHLPFLVSEPALSDSRQAEEIPQGFSDDVHYGNNTERHQYHRAGHLQGNGSLDNPPDFVALNVRQEANPNISSQSVTANTESKAVLKSTDNSQKMYATGDQEPSSDMKSIEIDHGKVGQIKSRHGGLAENITAPSSGNVDQLHSKKPAIAAYRTGVKRNELDSTSTRLLTLEQRIATWLLQQKKEENAGSKDPAKQLNNGNEDFTEKENDDVNIDDVDDKDTKENLKNKSNVKSTGEYIAQLQKPKASSSGKNADVAHSTLQNSGNKELGKKESLIDTSHVPKFNLYDEVKKKEINPHIKGDKIRPVDNIGKGGHSFKDEDKLYDYYYDMERQTGPESPRSHDHNDRSLARGETIFNEEDKQKNKEILKAKQGMKLSLQREVVHEADTFHTVENFVEESGSAENRALRGRKPKSGLSNKDSKGEVSVSAFKARVARVEGDHVDQTQSTGDIYQERHSNIQQVPGDTLKKSVNHDQTKTENPNQDTGRIKQDASRIDNGRKDIVKSQPRLTAEKVMSNKDTEHRSKKVSVNKETKMEKENKNVPQTIPEADSSKDDEDELFKDYVEIEGTVIVKSKLTLQEQGLSPKNQLPASSKSETLNTLTSASKSVRSFIEEMPLPSNDSMPLGNDLLQGEGTLVLNSTGKNEALPEAYLAAWTSAARGSNNESKVESLPGVFPFPTHQDKLASTDKIRGSVNESFGETVREFPEANKTADKTASKTINMTINKTDGSNLKVNGEQEMQHQRIVSNNDVKTDFIENIRNDNNSSIITYSNHTNLNNGTIKHNNYTTSNGINNNSTNTATPRISKTVTANNNSKITNNNNSNSTATNNNNRNSTATNNNNRNSTATNSNNIKTNITFNSNKTTINNISLAITSFDSKTAKDVRNSTSAKEDLNSKPQENMERASSSRRIINERNNYVKVLDHASLLDGSYGSHQGSNTLMSSLTRETVLKDPNSTIPTEPASNNTSTDAKDQLKLKRQDSLQEHSNFQSNFSTGSEKGTSLSSADKISHTRNHNSSQENVTMSSNKIVAIPFRSSLDTGANISSHNLTGVDLDVRNNISTIPIMYNHHKLKEQISNNQRPIISEVDSIPDSKNITDSGENSTHQSSFKMGSIISSTNQTSSRNLAPELNQRQTVNNKVSPNNVSFNLVLNTSHISTNISVAESLGDPPRKLLSHVTLDSNNATKLTASTTGGSNETTPNLAPSKSLTSAQSKTRDSRISNSQSPEAVASVQNSSKLNVTLLDRKSDATNQHKNVTNVSRDDVNTRNRYHNNDSFHVSNNTAGVNTARRLLSVAETVVHEKTKDTKQISTVGDPHIKNNNTSSRTPSNITVKSASRLNLTPVKKITNSTDTSKDNDANAHKYDHNSTASTKVSQKDSIVNSTQQSVAHNGSRDFINSTRILTKPKSVSEISPQYPQNISAVSDVTNSSHIGSNTTNWRNETRESGVQFSNNLNGTKLVTGTENLSKNKTVETVSKKQNLQPEVMANEKERLSRTQDQKVDPDLLIAYVDAPDSLIGEVDNRKYNGSGDNSYNEVNTNGTRESVSSNRRSNENSSKNILNNNKNSGREYEDKQGYNKEGSQNSSASDNKVHSSKYNASNNSDNRVTKTEVGSTVTNTGLENKARNIEQNSKTRHTEQNSKARNTEQDSKVRNIEQDSKVPNHGEISKVTNTRFDSKTRNTANDSTSKSNIDNSNIENTEADSKSVDNNNNKNVFLYTSDVLKNKIKDDISVGYGSGNDDKKSTEDYQQSHGIETDLLTLDNNKDELNINDKTLVEKRTKKDSNDDFEEVDSPEGNETKSLGSELERMVVQNDVSTETDDVTTDVFKGREMGSSGSLSYFTSSEESVKIPEMSAYRIQDFSLLKPGPQKALANRDEDKNKKGSSSTIINDDNNSRSDTSNGGGGSGSGPRIECDEACTHGSGGLLQRPQAAVSAVLTTHFGPTKDQMIPFDLELLDLADNYDNTTGMFICTIPGTYVISLYLMSHPGAKVNARILINNRPIAALWADDAKNAGFYPSSSTQTIAQLAFGDQVYVMLVDSGYGDSWVHANYNVFTIFLLYEQMF